MSNVAMLKLPQAKNVGIKKKAKRKASHHNTAAIAIGGVAAVLVSLSLSHLAHGIHLVTQSPTWEAWAMAIGIDLGFVALELSLLATAANDKLQRKLAHYANPAIVGTLVGSAVLNALAFAYQANGTSMMVIAGAIGIAIPAMIYALTKIGAIMWMDGRK